MSVAEAAKELRSSNKKRTSILKEAVWQTVSFVLGLLFALSGINEEFSPFGAAAVAAAGKKQLLSASAGASLGYLLCMDSIHALRYIASILAIDVILSALRSFRTIRDHQLTPILTAFVCVFITGLAIAFSKPLSLISMLVILSEALVGGVSAWLFAKSRSILLLKGSISALTSKETFPLLIVAALLLLSVKSLVLFSIHPSLLFAVLLVLISARYAREAGGAIVGVSVGAAMALGYGDTSFLAVFALGGLLAGAFSGLGKLASAAAFLFSAAAVSVIGTGKPGELSFLITEIISSAVFLLLPRKVNERLQAILTPAVRSPIIDTVKSDVTRRLKNAADISAELCTSLGAVTDALIKNERMEYTDICIKSKENVCGSCGLYDACWNESYEDTSDCFNTLLSLLKEGVFLEYKTVPVHFSGKCIRTEMIAGSFNKLYTEYRIRERLQNRADEIHSIASDQFINVSSLLNDLSDRVNEQTIFDMDLAARARSAALACGLKPLESCCVISAYDQLSLEISVKTPPGTIEIGALTRQLELVTDRKLELPLTSHEGEKTVFSYREKAALRIIAASVQFCSSGEKYSGDAYSTFEDDDGMFYCVICDGMGTGGKAAIGANLAVSLLEKLIKAGFGIVSSIRTVNTSLISKSGDECSVTLDLAAIDRFTGHITFYKCGAAGSVIRKGGKLLDLHCPSLPLGILREAESANGTGTLTAGDVVLMMSDGVRDEDNELLKRELHGFGNGNVRTFTQRLAELIRCEQPERNDDLTLITLAVTASD